MVFEDEGLVAGVGINLLGSVACVAAAWVLLRRRSVLGVPVWQIYRPLRPHHPPTLFRPTGNGRAPGSVCSRRDAWLEELQGEEALIYLSFLKSAGIVFAVIAVFTVGVLLPVNNAGGYREHVNVSEGQPFNPGIADWTTQNLPPRSAALWAHLVVSLLIAGQVYGLVWNTMALLRRVKCGVPVPRTLLARAADMPAAAEDVAERFVAEELRGQVRGVCVPLCAPRGMLRAMRRRDAAAAKLRHWVAFGEKAGLTAAQLDADPRATAGCLRPGSATAQLEAELRRLDAELAALSAAAPARPPAGAAFITFADPADCAACVRAHNTIDARLRAGATDRVWFAPPAQHVLWDNVGRQPWTGCVAGLLTAAAMTFLLFWWTVPVAFLSSLDNVNSWVPGLKQLSDASPWVKGTLTAYLPVIALSLFNLLLPYVMRYWSQHVEGAPDRLTREHLVLKKVFVFGLLSSVILQAGLQGVESASDWIESAKSDKILWLLVGVLAPKNGYFPLKVMQAAFLGNMVRTLRVGDLIICPILGRRALTAADYAYAYEKYPFYFSEEYAYALVVCAFGTLFAVSVPIIPLFAAFYFAVKYYCDRATLADCYPRCRPSDLRLVPTVAQCALSCVTVLQVFGVCGLAALSKRWDVCGVAAVAPLASVAMHVWLWRESRALLGPRLIEDILQQGADAGVTSEAPSVQAALRAALAAARRGVGKEATPLLCPAPPSEVSLPPYQARNSDDCGGAEAGAGGADAAYEPLQGGSPVVAPAAAGGDSDAAYTEPCAADEPRDTEADIAAIREGRWYVEATPEAVESFSVLPSLAGESPFF